VGRAILVTGFAGSGKSRVSRELRRMGYLAFDIENVEGLFRMVEKATGGASKGYDNTSVEDVKTHDWMCDTAKLRRLIKENSQSEAYYCGVSSNIDELLPLFDEVILLVASEQVLRRRLGSRGPDEFGGDPRVQRLALGWKEGWEDHMRSMGPRVVDADQAIGKVISNVLEGRTKRPKG
jgi:hypothetical protein